MTYRQPRLIVSPALSGLLLLVFAFIVSISTTTHPTDAVNNAPTETEDCTPVLGEWQTAAEGPFYHLEGATAVVRGKLYVFTGFASNDLIPGRRVEVYNPVTNIWESQMNPRQRTPLALSHVQAVAAGRFVWLAGGFIGKHPGKPTSQVWRYDTANDTWTRGPNLPSMRAGGALVKAGQTLHYFGGLSKNRDSNKRQHWTLDLNNPTSWKYAPVLPEARNHMNGVAIGGMVYAIGGQYRHDTDPVDVDLMHMYNPTTKVWTPMANLPTPRSHFEQAIVRIEGKIVIVGGRNNQAGEASVNRVTMYNPHTNAWSELRALPTPLLAPVAAYVKKKLIVTYGGADYNKASNTTYVSEVTFECDVTPPGTILPLPAAPTTD